jgi:alpha/beta superfamily hydrolase
MTTSKKEDFPVNDSKLFIEGPVGILEAQTTSSLENGVTGVICHPHPLMGGMMSNKVVTTVARAFKEMGLRTVRFNFRGVGESAGQYAEGLGETDDLLAVLQWVKDTRSNDAIWLAGFSFGAYVALRAANVWPIAQLVTIAPAVHLRDCKTLPEPTCPWLLIQGENDEVVDPNDVFSWAASKTKPPKLVRMSGAGHFFHGRLVELREILIAELKGALLR